MTACRYYGIVRRIQADIAIKRRSRGRLALGSLGLIFNMFVFLFVFWRRVRRKRRLIRCYRGASCRTRYGSTRGSFAATSQGNVTTTHTVRLPGCQGNKLKGGTLARQTRSCNSTNRYIVQTLPNLRTMGFLSHETVTAPTLDAA